MSPPDLRDIEVYPFDGALHPSVAHAPALSDAMLRAARAGESPVRGSDEEGDQVLVRVPYASGASGACSWVLARKPRPPFVEAVVDPLLRTWALPMLAMIAAIALGLGPIVRRTRRLAREVRASARERYRDAIRVEGDDEIGELARAFAEAAREVRGALDVQEARERTLREFLANTTHDVMTPLTVLQGHLAELEGAARDGRAFASEGERRALASAIDELAYTTSLVRNLEVAARLEAGEPHVARAPVDLGRLVERVLARHRPLARPHAVEIEAALPEAPIEVLGDETFLEQALGNVVFNAIRHRREDGGHVAIVLERAGEARFRLRVLDDGPGVPAEELARIAERNVRGDAARTRHPDGRGLGLAIAMRVSRLHDWTLRFENGAEGGLVVTFEGASSGVATDAPPTC